MLNTSYCVSGSVKKAIKFGYKDFVSVEGKRLGCKEYSTGLIQSGKIREKFEV